MRRGNSILATSLLARSLLLTSCRTAPETQSLYPYFSTDRQNKLRLNSPVELPGKTFEVYRKVGELKSPISFLNIPYQVGDIYLFINKDTGETTDKITFDGTHD